MNSGKCFEYCRLHDTLFLRGGVCPVCEELLEELEDFDEEPCRQGVKILEDSDNAVNLHFKS
jgi:hypothetical protein